MVSFLEVKGYFGYQWDVYLAKRDSRGVGGVLDGMVGMFESVELHCRRLMAWLDLTMSWIDGMRKMGNKNHTSKILLRLLPLSCENKSP